MSSVPFEGTKRNGPCHTLEECKQLWLEIPKEKKIPVKEKFFKDLKKVIPDIQKAIGRDPENWYTEIHFWWGMGFRNWLREQGYGEEYWPVHNLDCIYVQMIEDFLTS